MPGGTSGGEGCLSPPGESSWSSDLCCSVGTFPSLQSGGAGPPAACSGRPLPAPRGDPACASDFGTPLAVNFYDSEYLSPEFLGSGGEWKGVNVGMCLGRGRGGDLFSLLRWSGKIARAVGECPGGPGR